MPSSRRVIETARAGGAVLRPSNRHLFDSRPAPPAMTERKILPLPPADRHDLAKSAAYLGTAVKGLQPQRRLNLFGYSEFIVFE